MRKISFMVVDDSTIWQKLIKNFIEKHRGWKVIAIASDGKEAVEKYKKYSPDIVTMDVEMPFMDGITAVKNILQYDKNAYIIMVSSKGEEDIIRKALLMGAKDYIIKNSDFVKWEKRFQDNLDCYIKNKRNNFINNLIKNILFIIKKSIKL